VADETGQIAVDLPHQSGTIGGVGVMAGGAQAFRHGRMNDGAKARQGRIKIRVAECAEISAGLLEDEHVGKAVSQVTGLAVFFGNRIVAILAVEFSGLILVAGIARFGLGAERLGGTQQQQNGYRRHGQKRDSPSVHR
jgi:hypothetical protein